MPLTGCLTIASIIKGFEALAIEHGALADAAKGPLVPLGTFFCKPAIPILAFSADTQKPKLASHDEQDECITNVLMPRPTTHF